MLACLVVTGQYLAGTGVQARTLLASVHGVEPRPPAPAGPGYRVGHCPLSPEAVTYRYRSQAWVRVVTQKEVPT